MESLQAVYEEKCAAATVDPRQEFINEIQQCISEGRATIDVVIDGGITYNKLEDKDLSAILETLSRGGCIRSICVPRNNLTDLILPAVAQLISQSDSITQIDLSANQITSDGVKSLQDALVQSQSLTHVSFSQNDIGDDGCLTIIKALRNNRTITHVNLSDTSMSHNALTVLGAQLSEIERLKSLNVDNPHNLIDGDQAAKRLFLSLQKNRALSELSIARAKLGDDCTVWLSEVFFVNSVLQKLRLRSNGISSVGAERLATALRENSVLKVLDISGNKISDKGAQAFAEMLKVNTTIEKLDLQNNGIHGVGLLSLCRALPENTGVRQLALWGNAWVDNSVKHAWGELLEGPRASTLSVDFIVRYTDDLPYLARTPPDESPKIWS